MCFMLAAIVSGSPAVGNCRSVELECECGASATSATTPGCVFAKQWCGTNKNALVGFWTIGRGTISSSQILSLHPVVPWANAHILR